MRVNGVVSGSLYSGGVNYSLKNRQSGRLYENHSTDKPEPSFKGCHAGKVIGFLAGAAVVVAFAPAVAAIGLAGIGALPGALAGAIVDDKIDEAMNKGNQDSNKGK